MTALTHLSLFSGIGGLDLAAEWAGFETVGQCEWADYPTKVLEKHWPNVPRWRDIRTLNGESFYERTGRRTVDVISGGFPCQPFSVAGNQKGKEDERYLWPEMLRVIRELAPRWVIGENVSGILQIAAADVVKDLERIGYNVAVFNFEAAAVGARHRRERVFFVGNAESDRGRIGREDWGERYILSDREWNDSQKDTNRIGLRNGFINDGKALAYTESDDAQRCKFRQGKVQSRGSGGWPTEFGLGGVADGVSYWMDEPDISRIAPGAENRVDRLKSLGNAVVPQQAYPIFKAIAELERGETDEP